MSYRKKKHWFLFSILASVLFHILLFGLISLFLVLRDLYFIVDPDSLNSNTPPLVFDFTDTKTNELAETDESSRVKDAPENARFASDKNARAQNEASPDDLAIDKAYSEGYAEAAQIENLLGALEQAQAQEPQPDNQPEKLSEFGSELSYLKKNTTPFSREMLVKNTAVKQANQPGNSSVQHSAMDNQMSRALDMGALSFNTYEWDFAPYMLKLKRVIEEHIYPPAAFSKMGIISGRSQIKFRIERDGSLTLVDVLGYEGHVSLMQTSKQAIEVSIPFDQLPSNFPEQYLEVTATFVYKVYR
ncbi:MAG: hypothetical protein DWQ05_19130 [Calditrichaeota bacterium]|nr:MAG: hypothetical protein DWQ05_19130 [Calditrichota bacterium]